MRGYALDHIKTVFPPWEIKSSQSQAIDIKTEFPFSLERYLGGGQVERVLVVPPIINHPWILDMRPEISVIQRFCERGFEVYMIRWNCDHEQDIGFYQMISFIREVLGKIGNTSIFWLLHWGHHRAFVHLSLPKVGEFSIATCYTGGVFEP
jgi:hypothetical protein